LTLLSILTVLTLYTYTLATSIHLDGEPTPLWMTLLLLAGGALTYVMYLWERCNYLKLKLEILRADALHAKIDTALSLVSVAAVVLSSYFHLLIAGRRCL
jgi:Predicted Co/Zn/Cd cation transporters